MFPSLLLTALVLAPSAAETPSGPARQLALPAVSQENPSAPATANGNEGEGQATVESAAEEIAPSISEDSLHRHVRLLADDDLHGRRAGSGGAAVAAAYLIDRWKASGIQPKGKDGFRQPFTVKKREMVNLVGWIEGSDETLRDQFVLIGAHYDHIGERRGAVYSGADDNASGCAVVAEVAAAIAAEGGFRRSILILAFDGEEIGLRGSRHFANHPTVDQDAIVAMINMDMVSRGETGDVRVCGTPSSPELKAAIETAAPAANLTLHYDHEREWRTASDHASFATVGIPWLYIGVLDHDDYHKPTDTADKSNQPKMLRIARLVYLVVKDVANRDDPPTLK